MEQKGIADADPSAFTFKYPRTAAADNTTKVRAFIDEEAEVSSRSDVSEDEEEDNCNTYEGSFIDDQTSLSEAATQAEAGTVDMMAIYRRSLLSQSPRVRKPEFSSNTDDFTPIKTRTTEKGSISSKMTDCNSERLIGHSIDCTTQLDSDQLNPKVILLSADPCSSSRFSAVKYCNGSRKRKPSSQEAEVIAPINLEKQFFAHSEVECPKSFPTDQSDKTELNGDIFGDDTFFEGLDLDAIEAQATMLLKSKADEHSQKQDTYDEPGGTPNFDIGI